jgi:hypothetical protein
LEGFDDAHAGAATGAGGGGRVGGWICWRRRYWISVCSQLFRLHDDHLCVVPPILSYAVQRLFFRLLLIPNFSQAMRENSPRSNTTSDMPRGSRLRGLDFELYYDQFGYNICTRIARCVLFFKNRATGAPALLSFREFSASVLFDQGAHAPYARYPAAYMVYSIGAHSHRAVPGGQSRSAYSRRK